MTAQRILVTGGAGFIGSHYTRTLLRDASARVTVLDALTYAGNRDNLRTVSGHPGLRFVHGDIRDAAVVDRLMAGSDQVVHFAAESHVDRSIADGRDFTETNVVGTQTLLDAARRHGVRRFVHVSTDEVYGSLPSGAAAETAPLRPSSPYAASKAASDLMALAYHRTYGLDVLITRCSNNYGTHQHPEKLIPRFVTRLLSGRSVPLFGDGGHTRDWLHVEDHVRGIELVRAHGSPGEVYNIGGGTALTNKELTGRLLESCGRGWDMVDHVRDREGHDRRYAVDDSKIRSQLGYRTVRVLGTALEETVRWYRDHPQWWAPHTEAVAR
ncbi:dTDP-glucose 4,6-dehydratase [Streptomyces alfalfae]|uniref:dTDP-glucose 4,6-dehydratase n=1 Tax=Streptomyces alfalfae TaxID=1642299 RepID=A0ABM6GP42_9ACTN|nr:dTDP-glucose 4,6-dehydratase [Streptomyces alfalfae]APY85654.1 dTDP-glucose 4,6-dehydratase [Streptomyces alfalfae]AYA16011.1 dTDP-glucose 4,6-dehydratase [Streptomyces fradiae]RXX39483.1 dTDP-glucose 4,6-dehydratase [Streptomyces alfalfae]RZN05844.1 dTDP-glucose 4,6-dehydratase [Streptomyces alfalfae]